VRKATQLLVGGALLAVLGVFVGCGTSNTGTGSTSQNDDSGGSTTSDGAGGVGSDGSKSSGDGGTSPEGSGGDGAGPIRDAAADGDGGTVIVEEAGTHSDGSSASDAADSGTAPYKGLAGAECAEFGALGVSWYYNWDLSPPCSGGTSPPFVPMIWGHTGAEQTTAGIASELSGVASAGYSFVLGFNEPDNTGQSNIPDAATAISLWPAFTTDPSVRVGSPATSANSNGQAWFTTFMKDVNADTTGQLRVDFIAAHWYGWNSGSCDAAAANLESYISWLEGFSGNRPIWLTEWGCLNDSNPSEAVVQAFFQGAVAMFKNHPRLERYAWYPWTANNEVVGDGGTLTSLGTVFAAAPAHP
jgi:hypothetical protein